MKKLLGVVLFIGIAISIQGCAIYPAGYYGGYGGYSYPYYGYNYGYPSYVYRPYRNYGWGGHYGWGGGHGWNGYGGGGHGWGGHGWGGGHGHH